MTTRTPQTLDIELPLRLQQFLAEDPAADLDGSGETTTISAPFTGQQLGSFRANTADDVRTKAQRARIAGRSWRTRPARERAAVILRLHTLIRSHEELFLDIIQAENGKARLHAYDEVLDAFNACRYIGRMAPAALRRRRKRGAVPGLTTVEVDHTPVGLVGFISPWNYPMSLGGNDVFAALAAGNAVLQKPDSSTPLSVVLLRRLAISAGLPAEVWQLVPGPVDAVGDALLATVDGISFTGSSPAGRKIGAQAAERLIPAALELGGKNPLIVCADADIDTAVEGAVRACFSSSGQLCLSVERIYVVDDGSRDAAGASRYQQFCERFAAVTAQIRVGAAFDYSEQMGSLSSPQQLRRVSEFVDDAVAAGATVLTGGHALPQAGPLFYAPTVLTDVPDSARLKREETFGPVVAVYPVSSDAEAVLAANDTDYGLNASVWSGSKRHGMAVARQIEAGMVNVNEAFAAVFGSFDAPSGGMKASGLGERHGIEGIREFTRARAIAHQALLPIAPFGPVGPERFQKIMTTTLSAMKALGLR